MRLEVADNIRIDWGKFLETGNGPLRSLFLSKVPKSFLPYPKETIEEALNIMIDVFKSQGNLEVVKVLESTLPILWSYVDDEEAIREAGKNFTNEKYLNAILLHMDKWQQRALKELENKSEEQLIEISKQKNKLANLILK